MSSADEPGNGRPEDGSDMAERTGGALERPDRSDRTLMRVSDAERQRVADALHVAMQEGRLKFEELEERLSAVYAAKTFADLEPITADLPSGLRPSAALQTGPAPAAPERYAAARTGPPTSIGIMSGCDRGGGWTVPESHTAFAMMGGVRLDLREARFAASHVTIRCIAIMGGIQVIVPEDMDVECDGIGIMGGFAHRGGTGDGRGPHVRIVGVAFWGGVNIQRAKRGAAEIED